LVGRVGGNGEVEEKEEEGAGSLGLAGAAADLRDEEVDAEGEVGGREEGLEFGDHLAECFGAVSNASYGSETYPRERVVAVSFIDSSARTTLLRAQSAIARL
jgi:hypothetical protein